MSIKVLATSAAIFLATISGAFAERIHCRGITYSGEVVSIRGEHYRGVATGDFTLYSDNQAIYYWDAENVRITGDRYLFKVIGVEDDFAFAIVHPNGYAQNTSFRVILGEERDNEFLKATCTFK